MTITDTGHGHVIAPVGPPRVVEVRLRRLEHVHNPHEVAPTDIMFQHGKAFHNAAGHGPVEHEHAHAQDPHTIVALRSGVDSVKWIADEPFAVVRIVPHGHAADRAAGNPFDELTIPACAPAAGAIDSGTPRRGTRGRFKATFAIGNELIDPDIEIFP
jgi:hypothetical protein